MANFDLTNLAVKIICPNNVVKTDDTDLPFRSGVYPEV